MHLFVTGWPSHCHLPSLRWWRRYYLLAHRHGRLVCQVVDALQHAGLMLPVTQIIGAIVFISGYGGPDVTRLAAQSLLLFLAPITFIVHDFWVTPKSVLAPGKLFAAELSAL